MSNPLAIREQHYYRTGIGAIGAAGNFRRRLPRYNIVWRIQGGVDPPLPRSAALRVRQFKDERLPVSVEDEVEAQTFRFQFCPQCYAMRTVTPVGLVKFHSVPSLVRLLDQRSKAHALA